MSSTISIAQSAEMTLSSLSKGELRLLRRELDHLAKAGFSSPSVKKLGWDQESTYALNLGNKYWVVLRAGEGEIKVVDVLNRKFVERYG